MNNPKNLSRLVSLLIWLCSVSCTQHKSDENQSIQPVSAEIGSESNNRKQAFLSESPVAVAHEEDQWPDFVTKGIELLEASGCAQNKNLGRFCHDADQKVGVCGYLSDQKAKGCILVIDDCQKLDVDKPCNFRNETIGICHYESTSEHSACVATVLNCAGAEGFSCMMPSLSRIGICDDGVCNP